ncbi:flagellar motor switch protein FliN [Rubrivirga sp.]|uniref:flagellar motor switch protein FliN n=1 Tax=Rubrivirga sp. TaxID=1885344 RepID=UPI003B52CE94
MTSTDAPMAPSALPDLSDEAPAAEPTFTAPTPTLGLLASVEIEVTVEFGRRRLPLGDVARLDAGSLVVLDTLAGEPLVVYANGRRIATGEAVVVDGQFGIRIQHLVGQGED